MFSTVAEQFYIPSSNVKRFQFLHTSANTFYFPLFFIIAILVCVMWYQFVVWICISLMTNNVEHLFMWLFAISISLVK